MSSGQSIPTESDVPVLKSRRTGILVIHGIGEQNPYETLDSFARGLFQLFRKLFGEHATLSPREITQPDWTEVAMRIGVGPNPKEPTHIIDVHEYYWAPETEDKITLRQTLLWLLRTDLSPLRYLSQNLQAMVEMGKQDLRRFLWLFWREIRRIVFIFVPLAVLIVGLLYWTGHIPSLLDALKPLLVFSQGEPRYGRGTVFLLYALAAFMALFVLQSAVGWLHRRRWTMQSKAAVYWLISALVLIPFFYLAARWVESFLKIDMQPVWQALGSTKFFYCIGVTAAAAIISNFMVKFVGDVAVYTTADAKAKNYAARTAILKGSTEALVALLRSDEYDNVLLLGHSLGSVIAYDTINEVINADLAAHPETAQPPTLKKLTGLVTFGSPLDKIYYFFREHTQPDQAIRAQILSMLYSFRKVRSNRNYGEFTFKYERPQLKELRWLNVWSPLDPVSAHLHFYEVDIQKWFFYPVPVLAHLSYWRDPDFYELIAKELMLKKAPEALAAGQG